MLVLQLVCVSAVLPEKRFRYPPVIWLLLSFKLFSLQLGWVSAVVKCAFISYLRACEASLEKNRLRRGLVILVRKNLDRSLPGNNSVSSNTT